MIHQLTRLYEYTGVGSSDNYAYLVIDDKSKDAVIVVPASSDECETASPPCHVE